MHVVWWKANCGVGWARGLSAVGGVMAYQGDDG